MASYAGTRAKARSQARKEIKKAKQSGQSFDRQVKMRQANQSAKNESHSGGVSRSGQRAKARHDTRIAVKNIRRTVIGKPLTKSYADIQGDTQQKIAGIQAKYNVKRYAQGMDRTVALGGNLIDRVKAKALSSFKQTPVQKPVGILDLVKGMIGGATSSLKGTMQAEQAKPFRQRIFEGAQRAILGPVAGTQTGRKLAYDIPKAAARGALSIGLESPLGRGFEEAGRREIRPQEFGIERIIGKEPIKGVGTRALEYEEKLKEKGYKYPTTLAVAGATGATALDLWISGGGKQAISEIAKSKSPSLIKSLLKGKVADDLLDDVARQLVDVDKADDVARIIKQAKKSPLIEGKGNYLYHGTGQTSLENISKEGLKPGRHTGNISLSPNESYAKNWSRGGITPQGKTDGVMLRVNRDSLNTEILPSKSGVKADQLNELISKETIPPEAIEVYKNGKWQPLKSSPLIEEAGKGSLVAKKDISIYRGTGGGNRPNETMVSGTYFAEKPEMASKYGAVQNFKIPRGSKIFDLDAVKGNPNQTLIPKDILFDNRKTSDYLLKKGYDYTKNTNVDGVEYVALHEKAIRGADKTANFFVRNTPIKNQLGEPAGSVYQVYKKNGAWEKDFKSLEEANNFIKAQSQPLQGGVKSGIPKDAGKKLEKFMKATPEQPVSGIPTGGKGKTTRTLVSGQGDNVVPPLKSSLPKDISQEGDPVKKIIEALKEAKPIRGAQEALYSKARAQRVARVAAMGEKVPGEKGYFAQLGQLKGELPKAQFESIRKSIKQVDIDSLFNRVESAVITPFEKINAKTGLSKLLGAEGGQVPTKSELKLLNEIFPPEFMKAVLEKRPFMQKLWEQAGNVLNLPRAMMATADLSAPLRQGIFLIGKPSKWLPAAKDMFKYAFSEKAYQGLMNDIKVRPTYKAMRQSKLALTEMGTDLAAREEAFMSNLAEKIPVFGSLARGSNRAYTGFLNKLRADTFDDLFAKSKELIPDNPKIADDIAKFVNAATGRGDLGALNKASVVLNGAFFSPRLMASRLNLLNPKFYLDLEPAVRKEALKSLITFAGAGATILGLAKMGGVEVGTDPRSADFGKIKVGKTRYDMWGGFQQYMVLASRLISGEMVSSTTGREFTLGEGYKGTTRLDIIQRFFESKTSPVASFALGLLKGKTTQGEDLNIPADLADRFIPMVVQDMFELYRDKGFRGLGMALPAIFGVGVQTYGDQIPMESKTKSGAPSIKWRQEPGLGETLINKMTGKQVSTIPEEKQEQLRQEREADLKRQAEIDKAKQLLLQTGKTQIVGDTKIYLENGIVKTTKSDTLLESKQKYEEYKNLSDNEFKMRMIELKDQGDAQSTIADELMKYRRNDIAKEIGLEYEKDWSDLNNQDKSNIVMKKLNSLHEMDRGKLFQQMVDKDFITDPLKKEVGIQLYEKMKGTVEEKVDGLNMYEDGSEIRKTIVKAMFSDINAMKAAGSNDEAQAVVDRMSDADYETYKDARQAWRAGNTKKLDELMKVNTDEGVEFLRSLYEEEQTRILDGMTDDEWDAYKKAKEEYGTKTISELEKKSNEFYASINQDLYKRDAEYKAAVDAEIAKNTEAEQKLAGSMRQNVVALGGENATLASVNIGAGTLAARNNNPGNLRYAGQEGASQGQGGFARFDTPEAGYEALKRQIELDAGRGMTVSEFVSKYAPPTENDTATYIKQFNASVGSDSGTKLSSLDTDKVAEFMALKESSTKLGNKIASSPPVLNQPQVSLLRSVASGKTTEEQATKQVLDEFNKSVKDPKAQESAQQIALVPPTVKYSNIGYIPPEYFNPTSRIYGLIASLQLLRERWTGTAPELI